MPLTFYKKPAFVAYVTCGDPDLATTRDSVLAAIDGAARKGNIATLNSNLFIALAPRRKGTVG